MAQDCTKAVELNPKYVKALFRRAKAHEKLDNKKECLEGEGIFVFTYENYWRLCSHWLIYMKLS